MFYKDLPVFITKILIAVILLQDGRFLAGAGAVEIELARQIAQFGEARPGLEQYAIQRFAQALEALPKALAENSGVRGTELVSTLYAAHAQGQKNHGFNIEVRKTCIYKCGGRIKGN